MRMQKYKLRKQVRLQVFRFTKKNEALKTENK